MDVSGLSVQFSWLKLFKKKLLLGQLDPSEWDR